MRKGEGRLKMESLGRACMDGEPAKVAEVLRDAALDKKQLYERDADGRVPLHWAVSSQNEEIVQMVVRVMDATDPVDRYTDDAGWTPFHVACAIGNLDVVSKLYSYFHVDVNKVTGNGLTPLHLAVAKTHIPVCAFLLEHNANANVKDRNSQTPLHRAAAIGSMALVDLLCQAKDVNVDALDNHMWTPLFHSLAEGHAEVAVLLVNKYHASYRLEDSEGRKPQDVVPDSKVSNYFLANTQQDR